MHGKKDKFDAKSLLSVKFEDLLKDDCDSDPPAEEKPFKIDESSIIKADISNADQQEKQMLFLDEGDESLIFAPKQEETLEPRPFLDELSNILQAEEAEPVQSR